MTRVDWLFIATVILLFAVIVWASWPQSLGLCDVVLLDGSSLRCQAAMLEGGRLRCVIPSGFLIVDDWRSIERTHAEGRER